PGPGAVLPPAPEASQPNDPEEAGRSRETSREAGSRVSRARQPRILRGDRPPVSTRHDGPEGVIDGHVAFRYPHPGETFRDCVVGDRNPDIPHRRPRPENLEPRPTRGPYRRRRRRGRSTGDKYGEIDGDPRDFPAPHVRLSSTCPRTQLGSRN